MPQPTLSGTLESLRTGCLREGGIGTAARGSELAAAAIGPAAHTSFGERNNMNIATKRTVIATAALAAAGLFGSLPFDGSPLAQQGVPTVHRDVALVDVTDATLLSDEGTFDAALVSDVSGAETTLYTDLDTAYGATVANTLLDTTTGGVGDFNGAETAGFDGLYLDGLAAEDEVNQLVGISEAASQATLLNDLTTEDPTAVTSADLTALTGAVGTSAFDTELM